MKAGQNWHGGLWQEKRWFKVIEIEEREQRRGAWKEEMLSEKCKKCHSRQGELEM